MENAKAVLSYRKHSGTITLPGQNGRRITAAIEDVRIAIN